MGRDKAQVELCGHTLLERALATVAPLFDDVMVGGREIKAHPQGPRYIRDRFPERGPAVGLCAAMEEACHPYLFALACDMPFVSPGLIAYLASCRQDYDIVVPVCHGRLEPLCAVYGTDGLRRLVKRVEAGERGLVSFIEHTPELDVRKIDERKIRKIDPDLQSFVDIDFPEALSEAERILR